MFRLLAALALILASGVRSPAQQRIPLRSGWQLAAASAPTHSGTPTRGPATLTALRRELVAVEKQASMLRRGVDGLLDAGANRRHVGLVDAVVPSDARPQLKLVRARAGR